MIWFTNEWLKRAEAIKKEQAGELENNDISLQAQTALQLNFRYCKSMELD